MDNNMSYQTDILFLIKFACKRAQQHNHDAHHSHGIRKWGYKYLHNEVIEYISELTSILIE